MKTFHVQWHITNTCNLRCKHCYHDSYRVSDDLRFPQIQVLFDGLVKFLKKNKYHLTVDITGGEPFFHPDFWQIIQMLENCNHVMQCGIITNGTVLTEKILNQLAGFSKIKVVKISCEGSDKQSFEKIRPFPYEKFLKILELVSMFKFEKLLMFTLLETNSDQISGLFNLVTRFNLDGFIMERFFPMGAGKKLNNFFVTNETWQSTVKQLLTSCGMPDDLMLVAEYRGFKVLRKKNRWELFGAPCIVGKYGCAIMHDGNVFPCRRFVLSIGNALIEPFEKIWMKNPCRTMRRKNLKGNCGVCSIKKCYGCRALAHCIYGDCFAEDPLCFLNV
ncbi:MAG TPA: radical SAM protein [bacterium]|nr:radical SAM protein [bacterium]HOL49749.1 radical SAM protein [bacterium]HPO52156.1 radical SAM protein [bacterium]HXK44633.1 radical SAM protein [bacterium]